MKIFLLILTLFLLTSAYAGWRGAPWVPTRRRDLDRFLRIAGIKRDDVVYDLGCGDARVVVGAASFGAYSRGFELSLIPYIAGQIRRFFSKDRDRVKLIFGDFWRANLSDADLVYCFLMPKIYPRLKIKLEKELRVGTRVILYVWPMSGWTPILIDREKSYPDMYMYVIGKKWK